MGDNLSMWDWWRDDVGEEQALERHFAQTAATDPVLQAALIQLKVAKAAINGRMRELQEKAGA